LIECCLIIASENHGILKQMSCWVLQNETEVMDGKSR